MNFKEKRHAKKMAKIFITLAYGMMIIFFVIIIGGIILLMHNEEIELTGILMFSYVLFPFILIFVLGSIGQGFINKRLTYKRGISRYRRNTFFTNIIKLILADNEDAHKKAGHLYDCVNQDSVERKFLFSFILTSSYYSGDKKVAEKGKTRLMELLDSYDPKKIDLDNNKK